MSTVVVNIKTEQEVKQKAQQVAKELGVSLSALINAYLKQLIRTKKVELTLDEKPNKSLQEILLQAKKDYTIGKASPAFDNAKDAIDYLEKQGI